MPNALFHYVIDNGKKKPPQEFGRNIQLHKSSINLSKVNASVLKTK